MYADTDDIGASKSNDYVSSYALRTNSNRDYLPSFPDISSGSARGSGSHLQRRLGQGRSRRRSCHRDPSLLEHNQGKEDSHTINLLGTRNRSSQLTSRESRKITQA
jgi:hypothetical protein